MLEKTNQFISETDDQAKKCNLFSFSDQFICSSSLPIQITVTLLFFFLVHFVCLCVRVLGFHSFLQFQFIYGCSSWSSSSSSSILFFLQKKIFIRIKLFSSTHVHIFSPRRFFLLLLFIRCC